MISSSGSIGKRLPAIGSALRSIVVDEHARFPREREKKRRAYCSRARVRAKRAHQNTGHIGNGSRALHTPHRHVGYSRMTFERRRIPRNNGERRSDGRRDCNWWREKFSSATRTAIGRGATNGRRASGRHCEGQ